MPTHSFDKNDSPTGNVRAAEQFDYAAFEATIARDARAIVKRYQQRTRTYVIDTGRDLLRMKDRIEHGLFQRWTREALGIEPRTAQNFMQAAARFGDKSEIVARMPPAVIYALAAPSTPETKRVDVLRRVQAGEILQVKSTLAEIRTARAVARDTRKEQQETARRKTLSEEQRRAEDAEKSRMEMRVEGASNDQRDRLSEVAIQLSSLMSDELVAEFSDLNIIEVIRTIRYALELAKDRSTKDKQ